MNNRTFNLCDNFGLYCMEQQMTANGVRLICMLNGKKKEDGTYPKGFKITVVCTFNTCNIAPADYSKKFIDVYGGLTVTDYVDNGGNLRSQLVLFADSVTIGDKTNAVPQDKRTFNICRNFGLYCVEQNVTDTDVRLTCILNGMKKEDGTYPKGYRITVICTFDRCEITPAQYKDCYINVTGGITVSEYIDNNGNLQSYLLLFADKVEKANISNA